MRITLYFLLWCVICPLWHITHALDAGSSIEIELSDLEVHLKARVEDMLNAVVKKWQEA
ncbi:MAG: hypothetical protein AAGA46_03455 [Cyanobacteria bacterium P01_F01_bin.13]